MNTPGLTDLCKLLVENRWHLVYTFATRCRCMSCYSFQFTDIDDEVVFEGETLEELVINATKKTP